MQHDAQKSPNIEERLKKEAIAIKSGIQQEKIGGKRADQEKREYPAQQFV